jgi:hypothetical protein
MTELGAVLVTPLAWSTDADVMPLT